MQELVIRKLHDYIRDNNPDLLLVLQEAGRVTEFLQENMASVDGLIDQLLADNTAPSTIEELCMVELIKPLKPSRFNYLKALVEEEFPNEFERWEQTGILTTELINMITVCDPVFDEMRFSTENEDNRYLRYAIIGAMHEYFNKE